MSKDKSTEILFGKIVVQKGFATKEQVKEGLRFQRKIQKEKNSKAPRLGKILLKKGYLTKEQVKKAIQIQKKKIDKELTNKSRQKDSEKEKNKNENKEAKKEKIPEPENYEEIPDSPPAQNQKSEQPQPDQGQNENKVPTANKVRKLRKQNGIPKKIPKGVNLDSEESVIYYTNPSFYTCVNHWIITLFGFFLCIFLQLPLFVYLVPLGYGIWTYLVWSNTEYAVTNQRAISREGILSNSVQQAYLDKVTDVNYEQSFVDNILKMGKVKVDTAGSQAGVVTWEDVPHPRNAKNKISKAKELNEKKKRKEVRIERLKDKLAIGEISQEQFDQAKKQIKEETIGTETPTKI